MLQVNLHEPKTSLSNIIQKLAEDKNNFVRERKRSSNQLITIDEEFSKGSFKNANVKENKPPGLF